MSFGVIQFFVLASALASCSSRSNPPEDIVSSNIVIDPDAPALPAEGAPPATSMETEQAKVVDPPEVVEQPASAAIPQTAASKKNVIASPDASAMTQPAAAVPPKTEEPDVESKFKVVGSGEQIRYIKGEQLHIRAKPNRFSKSLGLVHGGDEVHVTIKGDWAKLEEGRWIRSRWLVKKRPAKFEAKNEN